MSSFFDIACFGCRVISPYLVVLLFCATISTMYYTYEVYPEIGMVVNSQVRSYIYIYMKFYCLVL